MQLFAFSQSRCSVSPPSLYLPVPPTMQLEHGLLVTEDALRVVTQLADVLSIEEVVPVLRRLPGPGTKQLINDPLVRPLWVKARIRGIDDNLISDKLTL